ncbi:hypothetical protein BLNAU_12576 [Blattamonas nauphoetae]|uniref:Uncharacterized protein n=1 Tax=Blattamonas nauphoetae TaxID=2049346 RepID=A0ABQ9XMP2_9EUKA|nr:hypothetical protein BLNAU_12576 [Blattamonas nauphoetae]
MTNDEQARLVSKQTFLLEKQNVLMKQLVERMEVLLEDNAIQNREIKNLSRQKKHDAIRIKTLINQLHTSQSHERSQEQTLIEYQRQLNRTSQSKDITFQSPRSGVTPILENRNTQSDRLINLKQVNSEDSSKHLDDLSFCDQIGQSEILSDKINALNDAIFQLELKERDFQRREFEFETKQEEIRAKWQRLFHSIQSEQDTEKQDTNKLRQEVKTLETRISSYDHMITQLRHENVALQETLKRETEAHQATSKILRHQQQVITRQMSIQNRITELLRRSTPTTSSPEEDLTIPSPHVVCLNQSSPLHASPFLSADLLVSQHRQLRTPPAQNPSSPFRINQPPNVFPVSPKRKELIPRKQLPQIEQTSLPNTTQVKLPLPSERPRESVRFDPISSIDTPVQEHSAHELHLNLSEFPTLGYTSIGTEFDPHLLKIADLQNQQLERALPAFEDQIRRADPSLFDVLAQEAENECAVQ